MDELENRREFTRVQVKLEAELQAGGKALIKGISWRYQHEWDVLEMCWSIAD